MRALVTGAAGFIGAHVAAALERERSAQNAGQRYLLGGEGARGGAYSSGPTRQALEEAVADRIQPAPAVSKQP